jgi:histidinol-phosphate phosphatase family protein
MRQAVILAGGEGTRLRPRLGGRPKPLVDIDGHPLLGRQLNSLRECGFNRVLILVQSGANYIREFCADSSFAALDIELKDDGVPRGTAGALVHAFDQLSDRFLVVYGDVLFDVDLNRMWTAHLSAQADATLFVHPNDHPFDSDLIELDENGMVVAFHAPPHQGRYLPNLVNAGMYVMERASIAFWKAGPTPSDVARHLFPAMVQRGARLHGYLSFEYIKDIGTPERLDKVVRQVRSGVVKRARLIERQRAVFLDRDGTINRLNGHIARTQDFDLIDGAADAIKVLNDSEFRVVLATNQPVIARGDCGFDDLGRIHNKLETLVGEKGAFIDRFYVCPHHPDRGFEGEVEALKIVCGCRKPATGLLNQARQDLNIDFSDSWLIGDSTSDMLAAQRIGLRSVLVETGEGGRDGKYAITPHFVRPDLPAAVSFIVGIYPKLVESVFPLCQALLPGDIVLVGGLARQGKSTIASTLKCELTRAGLSVEVFALDRFIRDKHQRGAGVLGRFDLDAARTILRPWLAGDVALDLPMPTYDRISRRQSQQTSRIRVDPDSILIIEGVPALLLDPKTGRRIFKVFVEGAEPARMDRVIQDIASRHRSLLEAKQIYQSRSDDETPVILASSAADFKFSMDDIGYSKLRSSDGHGQQA